MKTLLLGAILATLACGGAVGPNPGQDSGSDSSPPQDGGPTQDGEGPYCPPSPPSVGGECNIGSECEYGTSPSPDCNQLFGCMNHQWVDESSNGICPSPSQCPATYASVPQGSACTPGGLDCAYPQGTCFCSNGPGPVSMSVKWYCIAATPTCPSPRPDIGSACSSPGQMCDYGSCMGGVALQCTGGVWQDQQLVCAQ